MGLAQYRAAWGIEAPSLTKLVLLAYCHRACEICGLAWPGIKTITLDTGLGATRIREDLERLVEAGHLKQHAYGQGGRGRSTQYVVMPGLPGLSTAPCAKCTWNLTNPPRREGYDKSGTDKPTATRGVYAKPTATAAKTHRGGDPSPISEVLNTIADTAKTPRGGGA